MPSSPVALPIWAIFNKGADASQANRMKYFHCGPEGPASASWTALQTCTLTNGSIGFSDATWTNYPARFYRIRSP
jgi:hypothetical protein